MARTTLRSGESNHAISSIPVLGSHRILAGLSDPRRYRRGSWHTRPICPGSRQFASLRAHDSPRCTTSLGDQGKYAHCEIKPGRRRRKQRQAVCHRRIRYVCGGTFDGRGIRSNSEYLVDQAQYEYRPIKAWPLPRELAANCMRSADRWVSGEWVCIPTPLSRNTTH